MTTSNTNPPPSSNRFAIGVLVGLLIVLIAAGAVLITRPTWLPMFAPTATIRQPTATFAPDVFGITPIYPPVEVLDFTLPTALIGGETDDLSLSALNQTSGKYTLMFFGYTHCPDFCPTTLSEFVRIKNTLGEAAENVEFLFISVDSERDTPEVMRTYLDRFDESFYGMSADAETLAQIAPDYGLYYELLTDEGRGDNYLVEHTTPSYLIDPERRLAAIYDYNALPDDIAADIAARLNA